ncbi:MAG: flippase-like domain-containing protein [Chloroflexota bacterium]|nr:flippase-like domain-containing protein [Chloroflexota bacterium]
MYSSADLFPLIPGYGFPAHTHRYNLRRIAVELIAWSAVTWLGVSVVVFMGTGAFSLDVGFAAAVFLVIVTTFGFFVPSSPGSFGVYHAIVISTLTNVFNVGKNDAVSYALIMHLVFYLPPMLLGLGFLWRERQLWQRTSFLAKLGSFRREHAEQATGTST